MALHKRLGIIGAGKIGEALIYGLLKSNVVSPEELAASTPSEQRCEMLASKYRIKSTPDNREVARNSEVVIIAVRPHIVGKVLDEIKDLVEPSQLIISIATGVTTEYISKHLKDGVPIVRAMPNNPVLVLEGMTAIAKGPNAEDKHLKLASAIFQSVGKAAVVQERELNAITGLSGSGPAYIYMVIEALIEAGIKVGLSRELSTMLVSQTTLGSAKMVLETKEHPAILKDTVTTPGGCTIEGVMELEEGKLRTSFVNAVVKATKRAGELVNQ